MLPNCAVKIISGGHRRDNATFYYVQLNILKLNELYYHNSVKKLYKHIQNLMPETFHTLFTPISAIHK